MLSIRQVILSTHRLCRTIYIHLALPPTNISRLVVRKVLILMHIAYNGCKLMYIYKYQDKFAFYL